jgi:hypothetical protein
MPVLQGAHLALVAEGVSSTGGTPPTRSISESQGLATLAGATSPPPRRFSHQSHHHRSGSLGFANSSVRDRDRRNAEKEFDLPLTHEHRRHVRLERSKSMGSGELL